MMANHLGSEANRKPSTHILPLQTLMILMLGHFEPSSQQQEDLTASMAGSLAATDQSFSTPPPTNCSFTSIRGRLQQGTQQLQNRVLHFALFVPTTLNVVTPAFSAFLHQPSCLHAQLGASPRPIQNLPINVSLMRTVQSLLLFFAPCSVQCLSLKQTCKTANGHQNSAQQDHTLVSMWDTLLTTRAM